MGYPLEGVSPRSLHFARMAGSSIAAPDAAPWVTDFLNAAYFRREEGDRDVADLRLAFGVLTTYWYRKPSKRRLHLTDLAPFHRAYGAERFDAVRTSRGVLDRDDLLEGARTLLGDWFAAAWEDPARRGWGVAFPDADARDAYDPDRRMAPARVGALTPGAAPEADRIWHTYDPVALPSAQRALAGLARPETWTDYASELGRFTALRRGGLPAQTFEIDVLAGADAGRPVLQRGYVTATEVHTGEDPAALAAWIVMIEAGLARHGGEPRALPDGAEGIAGLQLTTHDGHFMGAGHSRLVLFRDGAGEWIRDVGTWDPLPFAEGQAYRFAGREAQHAFWGGGEPRQSMLHQLALVTAP